MNDWNNDQHNHQSEEQQNASSEQNAAEQQEEKNVEEKPKPRQQRRSTRRRKKPVAADTLSWDDFELAVDFYDRFQKLDEQTRKLFIEGFGYASDVTASRVTRVVASDDAANDVPSMQQVRALVQFVLEGDLSDFIQVAKLGSEYAAQDEGIITGAAVFYDALIEQREGLTASSVVSEPMTAFAKMLEGINTLKNEGKGNDLTQRMQQIENLFENWPVR